jgi:hypothetical protein
MARQIEVKVFGYICPPEVDVYANLPEFEPEFLVSVNYYSGRRSYFYHPADDSSMDVTGIRYVDGTPMTDAESDYWIAELNDQIEEKVSGEIHSY